MTNRNSMENIEYQDDNDVTMDNSNDITDDKKANNKKKKPLIKSKTDKLTEEVEQVRAELAETKDKFLRLFSEFDNYRKRTAKEKMEIISTASESVISKLLPILDDIERAQKASENISDIEAIKQGNELIFDKFKRTLQNTGLSEMISTGMDFNPDIHEAIANFPAADESQKNKIVDTVEKGYTLNDKVIRIAKVVVGN